MNSKDQETPSPRVSIATTSPDRVLLGLVLVSFLGAAFYSVTTKLPWQDEVLTLYDSRRPVGELLAKSYSHKGYLLAVKATRRFFGDTVFALRLPSLVLGTVALGLTAFLGKRLFSWQTGLLAAFYLGLHSQYLFFTTDARGYVGAVCFGLFGMIQLALLLEGKSWFYSVTSALCFYASYRMHPTGALLFPGVLLALLVVFGSRLREKGIAANKRLLITGFLFAVCLAGVFGPRLLEYRRWGTLLVPRFVLGRSQLELHTPSLTTWEGVRFHSAPFVSAPGHEDWTLWAVAVLFVAGIVLSPRDNILHTLFILLPGIAPILFLIGYNPPFLPRRYLFCALPFFVLLVSEGVRRISQKISLRMPSRFERPVEAVIFLGLTGFLGGICYGPFRAEVAFGGYGDRWMKPLVEVAEAPFAKEVSFFVAETVPFPKKKEPYSFWEKQLLTLGLSRDRFRVVPLYSPDAGNAFIEEMKRRARNEKIWIVTRTDDEAGAMRKKLEGAGFRVLSFGNGHHLLSAALLSGPTKGSETGDEKILRFLESRLVSDVRFFYSASRLVSAENRTDLGERLETAAIGMMEKMIRWDFSRTAGWMTSAVCRYHLDRGEIEEAGFWYCRAFGEKESRPHDYVGFLNDIPNEAVDRLARRGFFRPSRYARGMIRSFERAESLTDEYKAYWSYQGAQRVERFGGIRKALPLYRYSASCGDTQGRSSLRIYDFYRRKRKADSLAEGFVLAFRKRPKDPDLYLVFFEKTLPETWETMLRSETFDWDGYLEGLAESLSTAGNEEGKRARKRVDQIARLMEKNGLTGQAERLRRVGTLKEGG